MLLNYMIALYLYFNLSHFISYDKLIMRQIMLEYDYFLNFYVKVDHKNVLSFDALIIKM